MNRFTLIELMIVVVIIAIIAAVVLPALIRAKRSAEFKELGIEVGATVTIGGVPMEVLEVDLSKYMEERVRCKPVGELPDWYELDEIDEIVRAKKMQSGSELTGSDF